MPDAVCNPFIKTMYWLGPGVSTGFCGLHCVRLYMPERSVGKDVLLHKGRKAFFREKDASSNLASGTKT